jgi:hypothetical protein
MTDCPYCGCDVAAHDPVVVREGLDADAPERAFCNYGCLAAFVDAEGLATGTVCHIDR